MGRAYIILFIQGGIENTSCIKNAFGVKLIKWVLKERDGEMLAGFI